MKKETLRKKLRYFSRVFLITGLFLIFVGVGSYLAGYYMIKYEIHQVFI